MQTTVLRRLCADRPKALELMKLVAIGYENDVIRAALGFDDRQFDAEIDGIAADFELLSRGFFAHAALRKTPPGPASQTLTPAAEAALEIIGEELRWRDKLSSGDSLEALRAASFVQLVEKVDGDVRSFLAVLAKLPKLV